MAEEAVSAGAGRGRLIAFRVVSAIGAVLGLSGLLFVYQSFADAAEKVHRVHNLAQFWVLVAFLTISLLLGMKDPRSAVSPFRLLLALSLAMISAGLIGGDLVDSGYLIIPVIAAILLALHPARTEVWRCVKGSIAILLLGVLALIPAFFYALNQGDLQKTPPLGMEEHAEFHHFSGMALVMISFGLAAIATAFPGSGRRLAVWLTGLPAILLGATDLAFEGYVGSLNAMWAWVLILGGAVFILVGEMVVRREGASTRMPAEGAT